MNRSSALFVAGMTVAAPAALALAALVLEAATALPAARPIDAAFAALGVTNASPLPVRQLCYLGTYILAPLAAAALAGTALTGETRRLPFLILAGAGIALAAFWSIWSLANH